MLCLPRLVALKEHPTAYVYNAFPRNKGSMQWRGRFFCAHKSAFTETHAAALLVLEKMPLGGREGEDFSSMSSSAHVAQGVLQPRSRHNG